MARTGADRERKLLQVDWSAHMVLDAQQIARNILLEHFLKTQKKNSRFSIRAFALKLGISSAALSEILRGKRKISQSKALEFAKRINMNSKELDLIEKVFNKTGRLESLKNVSNPLKEILICSEEFDLMADWVYFAVVGLMRTSGFNSDVKWMACRLGLSEKVIADTLHRLMSIGVISQNPSGEYKDNLACYRTTEAFPDEMIRKRQINGLQNAIERIANKDALQFGVFSTISADISKLPEAKLLIEDFVKRLSLFLAEGNKTEVLELNVQLFPLTKEMV